MSRLGLAVLLCAAVVRGVNAAPAPAAAPLTVYAAASLSGVLPQLTEQYTRDGGPPVRLSLASSAVLARQIEAGANADLFISADQDWMDYLAQRNLIRTGSRVNLLGNRLALVAAADSRLAFHITPGFALASALGNGRLALADPDSVPAGRYARAALISLGVWDSVAARIVRAEDVRGALAFVARGESPLGIVYQTDARADARVRVLDLFPVETHPPVVYPLALTSTAGPTAAKLLDYLRSAAAAAVFERAGFTALR